MNLEEILETIDYLKKDKTPLYDADKSREIDEHLDLCKSLITEAHRMLDPAKKNLYLEILSRAIQSDIELGPYTDFKSPEEAAYLGLNCLTWAIHERVIYFLDMLSDNSAYNAYQEVVFYSKNRSLRNLIAIDALPSVPMLMKKKQRHAFKKIVRMYQLTLNRTDIENDMRITDTIASVLQDLEMLSQRENLELFLDVFSRTPYCLKADAASACISHMQLIGRYREQFVGLMQGSDSMLAKVVASNPERLEQMVKKKNKSAFRIISNELSKIGYAKDLEKSGGIVEFMDSVAKDIENLSKGNEWYDCMSWFIELNRILGGSWPSVAKDVLENYESLRYEKRLYFDILDEAGGVLEHCLDPKKRILTSIAGALIRDIKRWQSPEARKRYFSLISRVAQFAAGSDSKGITESICYRAADLLEKAKDERSIDDVVAAIEECRRSSKDLASVFTSHAESYRNIIGKKHYRKAFFDVAVPASGFLDSERLDILVWQFPEIVHKLKSAGDRKIYVEMIERLKDCFPEELFKFIPDNMAFFRNRADAVGYAEIVTELYREYSSETYRDDSIMIVGNKVHFANLVLKNYEQMKGKKRRGIIRDFVQLISRRRDAARAIVDDVLGGIGPYLQQFNDRELERYLGLIARNFENASGAYVDRWLSVGLECIKKFKRKSEGYFKYRMKESDSGRKIDDLCAIEYMLSQPCRPRNRSFNRAAVEYAPKAGEEKSELSKVMTLLRFFYQVDRVAQLPTEEIMRQRREVIKRKFAHLSDYVDILTSGMPDKRKTGRDDARRDAKGDLYTKEDLKIGEAQAILKRFLSRSDIASRGLEGLRDYIRNIQVRMSGIERFDELRVEEDACFLDDLFDRTGACISGDGEDREATLLYKLGSYDPVSKKTNVLEVNAYSNKRLVASIGKVILVQVTDKEDCRDKLLVEGVIVGPDMYRVHGPGDAPFSWERFVYEGILRYAKKERYRYVIVNAEHGKGQQCTHDFVRFVADSLNSAMNAKESGGSATPISTASLAASAVSGRNIQYQFVREGCVDVFKLKDLEKRFGTFEYTHNLEMCGLEKVITVDMDWFRCMYFDTWYRWSRNHEWNIGEGYMRGIELKVK